jgi:hypothetical protein
MSSSDARAQRLGSRRIAAPTTKRYLCVRHDRRVRAVARRLALLLIAARLVDELALPESAEPASHVGITSDATGSALPIAATIRAGKTRAHDVVAGGLERIARRDAMLNAFYQRAARSRAGRLTPTTPWPPPAISARGRPGSAAPKSSGAGTLAFYPAGCPASAGWRRPVPSWPTARPAGGRGGRQRAGSLDLTVCNPLHRTPH